jgi:hypothetical protein
MGVFFLEGSSLGAWDGQVYERLIEFAQHSQFNDKDVHEVFHKYLQPYVRKQQRMPTLSKL